MTITEIFENFHDEAFRLECLPEYLVESETAAINTFTEAGVMPKDLNQDWLAIIGKSVSQSKSIKRLRLLSKELTDYEKFELAAYKPNIDIGEDIRFAFRDDYENYQDFWIFDIQWMAVLDYDKNGKFVSVSVRKATHLDIVSANYWKSIFNRSPLICK